MTTAAISKSQRVWGAVLLTATLPGRQAVLRSMVVHQQGRWIRPGIPPTPSVPQHVTDKE